MYSFLLLIFLGICVRYCYKVYNIDVSEARTLFESNEQQFIVCGYGHTSMLDTPYYCMAGIKLGNIICLAKSKYKKYYPWFILPYIHFIDKGTTKIKDKRHITVFSARFARHSFYIKETKKFAVCGGKGRGF